MDTLTHQGVESISALEAGETRYYRMFSKNGNHFSVAADGGMTAGSLQKSGVQLQLRWPSRRKDSAVHSDQTDLE